MQDWSMVPLHIRCTERNKIDQSYPNDDAKWWKITEEVAERMGRGRIKEPYNGIPMPVLEYAKTLRGNRAEMAALAGACKVEVRDLEAGLRSLKRGALKEKKEPKYEEMTEGEIRNDSWLIEEEV